MAEMPRQLTQAEIDKILFNQRMNMQPQSIQNLNPNVYGAITPIPQNLFQRMAGGAKAVGDYVNRAGTAADVAKMFPGYTGQSQLTIPTGFNFAPKQAPTGEVIPGGLQTNQVNVNQLLSAIKPADVLGLTGAQQAYTDVGLGKAPKPMDVIDTLAFGAGGIAAGKGLLKAGKGLPVGMSVQDAPGLLQSAPKSDIGFYSAVEQAAIASPRKSATGQAFLNDIMKGPDVRADEIKWMGLDDFLKGKQNVTKQEVQDYIANNRVNVNEVQLGSPLSLSEQQEIRNLRAKDKMTISERSRFDILSNKEDSAISPNFSKWQLPGGENYRELLLTMPAKTRIATLSEVNAERAKISPLLEPINQSQYDDLVKSGEVGKVDLGGQQYQSSHFDQPNILAHLRVNDRIDADGKKMLLIEEVQSDWHQAGRDKGYTGKLTSLPDEYFVSEMKRSDGDIVYEIRKKSNPNIIINRDYNRQGAINGAINNLNDTVAGVPDAPFKDTWYQLALKRAIQHAAENGYDRIGLTTGSQQAKRFDLAKQVNEIAVPTVSPDGSRSVRIDPIEGTSIKLMVDDKGVVKGYGFGSTQFSGKRIDEVVGKEMAEKIMSSKEPTKFSGVDLSVGGEGMKKYYDEIYPKFLDKYGKKWNARVGQTTVQADGAEPIRYLDVTPEMKAGVSKGQPLFQAAPIITGGGLLGAQDEQR